MVNTQKSEGSFQTVMSRFGVGNWNESIYIPAGLAVEGIGSFEFYDYGEYKKDSDNFKRHLIFRTPESPEIGKLINSGKALIQYFELFEVAEAIEQSVGGIAVSSLIVPVLDSRTVGALA